MEKSEKLWSRNFVLIIVINFLVFMNHIMLLSTFPFYIESLGGSEALAGLAATLFSFVAVLCRPFVGWMLDNGKRRTILSIGLCGMILMPLGYMAASVIFLAFVFRMVHGAALALSNTSTATIASDVIPRSRFSEGMGMFVYSCNAAMFAAFLLLSLAPNNVTFILAAILAGYGFGGLEPALQSMAVHSSSPAERGSANSTFLCAYDIGIGLGGGIAGWLITAAGYENMFLVLSAANIISVLMYVFWGRHNPSSLSYSLRQAQKNEVK